MEGQTEFQTALKKTVVMFKTLTGKEITEEEGSIFINLLDMTEGYLTTGEQKGKKSAAQFAVMTEAKTLIKLVEQAIDAGPGHSNPVAREVVSCGINAAWDEKAPYVAPTITTSSREHIQGYDWQIVVLSREKDPRDSYVVHFAYQPTQEQFEEHFEEHFAKFVARTHYVHVNEWDRLRDDWVGVTSHYANTYQDRSEHNPRWEQADMAYRVRYYDRETGQLTFKYMPRKPSGNELATYHHLKGFAVVQSKVG